MDRIDAGTRSTIVTLIRRGETVERISSICRVPVEIVEAILDRMLDRF